jgi:hypothetical protein
VSETKAPVEQKSEKAKTTPEPRSLKNIVDELEGAIANQETRSAAHESAKNALEGAAAQKKAADKRVRSLKKELDLALRGKAA